MQASLSQLQARALTSLAELSAEQWDPLVADDNPFCRYDFLRALEDCQCATADNGWQPFHLTLWRDTELLGAAPCYLKSHSFGEFVFDWAWAHAYEQHGHDYYPKLLCGIPMTPVTGPRLLTGQRDELKPLLRDALLEASAAQQLSSAHINFTSQSDSLALESDTLLARRDIQFHWPNQEYADFESFLAVLNRKKRKNIRQERRRVVDDGWSFERIEGGMASAADLALMHQLYLTTFDKKGNWAPLTLEFFETIANKMSQNLLLVFASRHGQRQAGALLIKSATTLYGRYWGTLVDSPGLHFETCYYQGIEYAIEHGLKTFEPGAQGQHKLARGFLPTETRSFHQIADPQFAAAIKQALQRERLLHQAALNHYAERNPYRETKPH